jgi:hypothetical protein
MKKLLLLLSAATLTGSLNAQSKPYFQQDVAYTIHVKLDDEKHFLYGDEKLIYKNNSTDALPFIWMHIWPNAYKNNQTALGKQLTENGELKFHFAKDEDRGYIDSLNFTVDGQPVKTEAHPQHIDIIKIVLNQPLQPGGEITIATPFRVKIPSGEFSRLGHIKQQYQITQWYPKPAVYDRNGWNEIPYLDQGEFYSEFGKFDVFISVPKNYVVGATGDLTDCPEEVKWLDEKAAATAKKDYDYSDVEFPASSPEFKTLHYHQEKVHDFAWFCDKRYNVLKGDVNMPHSKRKVTTWVMFTNDHARLWKNSIPYVNDALNYYSLWNGDYPYNHCTAVDGALSAGGGMEYPNITVIGGVNSAATLETVIMHEVGHNWFYGILGSNERLNGWLDEGINSANELRYHETKYPNWSLVGGQSGPNGLANLAGLEKLKQKAQYYLLFNMSAKQHTDQPCQLHSADFTSTNYGTIMYSKTAVVFDYLRSYLGDTLYDKAMSTYFDRWKFKHPQPEDLFSTLEEVTSRKLNWLRQLINTTDHLDYKIVSATRNSDNTWTVTLRNTGDIAGPVALHGIRIGALPKTVWYEGFTGEKTFTLPAGDYDRIRIDFEEDMPEINRKNNTYHTHGLLRKAEPFKLQLGGSYEDPSRTQLFWSPVVGLNHYDKFMAGVAIYNQTIFPKKFQFALMPMYGFGSKELNGHGEAFFNIMPKKAFRLIKIGAVGNTYNMLNVADMGIPGTNDEFNSRKLRFIKIAPRISFEFKKKRQRNPVTHTLSFRAIWVREDRVTYLLDPNTTSLVIRPYDRTFYEANYFINNASKKNPWNILTQFQAGDNMSKVQITGNYKLRYKRNRAIDFRFFAGGFLSDAGNNGLYRFRLSGWGPQGIGNHDYLYDHVFTARNQLTGFFSRQMVNTDGAFKVYSPVGQTSNWLTSLNADIQLPFKPGVFSWLRLYADVGLYSIDGTGGETAFQYNAGLHLQFGIADVYLPLLYSTDIKEYLDVNDINIFETVRFSIRFDDLRPAKILSNAF